MEVLYIDQSIQVHRVLRNAVPWNAVPNEIPQNCGTGTGTGSNFLAGIDIGTGTSKYCL